MNKHYSTDDNPAPPDDLTEDDMRDLRDAVGVATGLAWCVGIALAIAILIWSVRTLWPYLALLASTA